MSAVAVPPDAVNLLLLSWTVNTPQTCTPACVICRVEPPMLSTAVRTAFVRFAPTIIVMDPEPCPELGRKVTKSAGVWAVQKQLDWPEISAVAVPPEASNCKVLRRTEKG